MKFTTEELEINDHKYYGVRLDEHKDVLFIIRGVKVHEENNTAKLSYNYDIIEGAPRDLKTFETKIGDFICYCIENMTDNFAYYGGVK